jgi:osmotically-inducible protein OsmY
MISLPAVARLDAGFPLIVQAALLEAECWLSVTHDLPGRTREAIMKACNVVNLLVVVGCVTLTSNVYAQASNAMPMASSPAASSGKATPADKKLARDVRKALSKAPNFNVSNVFVKARGGVVTLSGSVSDGPQIQQAAEVAKGVSGVTSVSNYLTLYTKGY